MKYPIFLSLVIPAFNEEKRLGATVAASIEWCKSQNWTYEIVIVDDGSSDSTLSLAKSFQATLPGVRAIACPHQGKGAAVRAGMLSAAGRYVLFMDADGATPLSQTKKLISPLERGSDVAIGSRNSEQSEAEMSPMRRLVGGLFARAVHLLAVGGIADSQCGFKMFRREVVAPVFARQQLQGFAFDVEILFIARRLGLGIVEVPIQWEAQPDSKVRIFRDAARMLWDISSVRWIHRDLSPHGLSKPAAVENQYQPSASDSAKG
jgi:dolichyl-phosphate beta-glucosyltransferase